MNDSPMPSAPAGIPGPAVEVEIPRGMFFKALDYAPGAPARAKPNPSQVKVSSARNRALSELSRLKDRLGVALAHLRPADDYGQVTASMDLLVAIADDFHDSALKLAKSADNAESRYEETFLATAASA